MKLYKCIWQALRVAVHDLISEEPLPPDDEVAAQITAAQSQLQAIRDDLTAATVREKRAQKEYRTAVAEANRLSQAVDDALTAGQKEQARDLLQTVERLLAGADEHNERYLAFAQASLKLRGEIERLRSHLESLRQRHESLADRESNVMMLEKLNETRRAQQQESQNRRANLEQLKERLAVREDRLAAWDEVDKRGLKDE